MPVVIIGSGIMPTQQSSHERSLFCRQNRATGRINTGSGTGTEIFLYHKTKAFWKNGYGEYDSIFFSKNRRAVLIFLTDLKFQNIQNIKSI